MVHDAPSVPVLLDCSVSLINRTGAHYIAQELAEALSDRVTVRRYRLLGRSLPRGILRKLVGRLMLRELRLATHVTRFAWPEPADRRLKRIFLDPLYVLRSRLAPADVVLCHDVGPVSHPSLYDTETTRLYAAAYAKIARVQPGMVFVSEASRAAFIARYGSAYRFLRVIPLYVREGAERGEEAQVAGIGARFFLTVGALERRKNQLAAIEGFAARPRARGYRYVLCGARATAPMRCSRARASPTAWVLGYVSDAQCSTYIARLGVRLPSLLEALACHAGGGAVRLIPILSRDSALTEAWAGCVWPSTRARPPRSLLRCARSPSSTTHAAPRCRARSSLTHRRRRARFLGAWRELFTAESRSVALRGAASGATMPRRPHAARVPAPHPLSRPLSAGAPSHESHLAVGHLHAESRRRCSRRVAALRTQSAHHALDSPGR